MRTAEPRRVLQGISHAHAVNHVGPPPALIERTYRSGQSATTRNLLRDHSGACGCSKQRRPAPCDAAPSP